MKELYEICSIPELLEYLELKGNNHNNYYHYTTWESVRKIFEGSSFLLTRGNSININDQHEALMKGSWEIWNKTYIGSFAYGSAENMAMWGLYGLPWEDAIIIEIPKAAMLKWVNSITEVHPWNKLSVGTICKEHFTVHLSDIVYVSGASASGDLILSRSNSALHTLKKPLLKNVDTAPVMTGYIKNYAWHYENEVRLHIQLTQSSGYEKLQIRIPQDVLDSINIITGPYFKWKSDDLYRTLNGNGRVRQSTFENLLNYRPLCSLCKHDRFERKE